LYLSQSELCPASPALPGTKILLLRGAKNLSGRSRPDQPRACANQFCPLQAGRKKLVAEYHHRPRTPDQGFQPYTVPEEQPYFEGEHLTPDGWQKVKTRDGAWISEQSTLGRFRVPLLTTEQILREPGWAKTQVEGFLVKNKTLLLWWYQPGKMQLNSQKEGLLFRGETPKTINEFRTLLKLLHI
jgi:hypothetical protein